MNEKEPKNNLEHYGNARIKIVDANGEEKDLGKVELAKITFKEEKPSLVFYIVVVATVLFILLFASLIATASEVTVRIPHNALDDGKHTLKINLVQEKKTTPPATTPPPAPRPPAGCIAGKNVKIINPTAGSYERTFWSVAPKWTYAFKFKTAPGTKPSSRRFAAARVSGSDRGKLLTISRCAGGKPEKNCQSYDAEASGISAYINIDPKKYPRVCSLKPGTTYYANVQSKYRPSDTGYNCGENPSKQINKCAFLYNQR